MSVAIDIFKAKLRRAARRFELTSTTKTYAQPHVLMSIMDNLDGSLYETGGGIRIGNTVLLRIVDTDESMLIKIVDKTKNPFDDRKVSLYSPLGSALLGKKVGDIISVDCFRTKVCFLIISVCT